MDKVSQFEKDRKICMYYEGEPERFLGAIIPPTFGNSLFLFSSLEELGNAVKDETEHYVYWRGTNPTVEIVEKKLAALEHGEQCKCFASGMAAITAALFYCVNKGDHVVCVSHIYKSTVDILKYLQKFGVEYTVTQSTSPEEIENEIRPNTKAIYIESPTDMTFKMVDLEKIAALAKERKLKTIADNTWATPLFQKPLSFGIDMVVHSASKYLGGHSDLVGGALITSTHIMKKLFKKEFLLFGGIMGPYEASLLLRGLRTLPMRMKAHEENANKVAKFLEGHPKITRVYYPGLSSSDDQEIIKKQLLGCSGLLAFELKDASFKAVKTVINNLKIFKIGVSWGSFESLVMSPNYGYNTADLKKEQLSEGLIRLSIGLESTDDLIRDLEESLERI